MAETAIIMPLLLICMFGAIDLGLLLWQWNSAEKATHFGVRKAVVSDPVALDLQNEVWNLDFIGLRCENPDGTPRLGNGVPICASKNTECHWDATAGEGGTGVCTGGYEFDEAAFQQIFSQMQAIFPELSQEHVSISYGSSGLGFVGHPYGTPVIVRVGIRCRTYQFVLLDALIGRLLPPNPCSQQYGGRGIPMPEFLASFSSEDLKSPGHQL